MVTKSWVYPVLGTMAALVISVCWGFVQRAEAAGAKHVAPLEARLDRVETKLDTLIEMLLKGANNGTAAPQ